MGVHRFASLAHEHVLPNLPITPLPRGSRVLVDGNGLAFYLLKFCPITDANRDRGAGSGARATQLLERDHGGDYAELDARVREAVQLMLMAGLSLEVWWDGPDKPFKAQTLAARAHQREDEEASLYFRCVEGASTCAAARHNEYPVPPMVHQQVRHTLRQLAVKQIQCRGEADAELARACAFHNASNCF